MNEQTMPEIEQQVRALQEEVSTLQAHAHAETTPTVAQDAPVPRVRVRFDAPAGVATPIQAAGRYWHDRSTYMLTQQEVDSLHDMPGFQTMEAAKP